MKLVRFKDGTYGVRRMFLFCIPEFLLLSGSGIWVDRKSCLLYRGTKEDAIAGYEREKKRQERLKNFDIGKAV